jgi:hypothetical protein
LGEYKGTLSQVSRNYHLWVLVVSNGYSTTAEKVVDELFKRLAKDIGPSAMISEMQGDGVAEAEQKFDVSAKNPRPVFIITQKHPAEWRKGDEAIKISMGRIKDPDSLRDFLFELAKLVRQDDFGAAKWAWRKRRISELASTYGPIAVGLIPAV